jgi:hypothetical protein
MSRHAHLRDEAVEESSYYEGYELRKEGELKSEVEKRTVPYHTASKVVGSAYMDPVRAKHTSVASLLQADASSS